MDIPARSNPYGEHSDEYFYCPIGPGIICLLRRGLEGERESVVGEVDAWLEFGFVNCVADVVVDVGEPGGFCADAFCGGGGGVESEVCGVWFPAETVDDEQQTLLRFIDTNYGTLLTDEYILYYILLNIFKKIMSST